MDIQAYRKLFPITLQKIYVSHASISPLSTRVTNQLDWYIDERSFGSVDIYKIALEIREKARNQVARLIHAPRPDQIAFITNTSEGLNHLAQGLEWKAGDQIILTDYEFPSNVYPFLNLRGKGVEVCYVPNRDGKIEIEDITALITPRTRLLSISFVEFSNGFRNDLETIGKICKDHDIIFSVDGIQGIGAIPIDVQKYGIDFISNGGHKWMMGLMGSGFIYIQDALFKKLKPAFTGWLGVENAWDFFDYDLTFLPDARRYEYATSNFIGITSLAASTELLLEAGIENIEKHLLELGQLLIDGLSDAGMKFAGSENKKFWSGIYSFSGDKIEELFKHLQASNVICALRNGRIRLAPHFYNSQEEIKEIIDIIGKFYSI